MAYNQIYGIINEAVKEALGASAVAVIDTSSLVDVGGQILTDETGLTMQKFMNGLAGAIMKTRIKAKSYEGADGASIYRDADDFALYVRKIQTDNVEACVENSSYKAQNWAYYNGSLQKNWTDRLFGKIAGLETKPTIVSRKQLARCFTSAGEMAAFISMLDTSRMNDMRCAMESGEILARATAMANAFIDAGSGNPNPNTAIDLGAIYNTVTGKATSSTGWIYDADLIRFMLVEIKRIIPRLSVMNRLFNNAGCDRFTRPNELVIDMHADFVASLEGYVENTLISPFLTMPNVNKVTRWQGTGTTTGADAYKLKIKNDGNVIVEGDEEQNTDPVTTLELGGIVCVLRDFDRVAATVQDLRSPSANNALQEMVTTVTKFDIAYAVDPSEQCVVFYVGDHNAT